MAFLFAILVNVEAVGPHVKGCHEVYSNGMERNFQGHLAGETAE
jgi:hypothetical protein